tara:strand:+ start:2327 stop:2614 length:288 start_codon:yes stop_codon:yes gene_type:complete
MATKPYTLYSDNPKMDESGITAKRAIFGYMGQKVGAKTVTGGKLYMEAINESSSKKMALTSKASLQKAAKLVEQGYSCDHAIDIVSKEAMHSEDD